MTETGAALLGDLSDENRAYLGEVASRLGADLESVTRALEILATASSSFERDEECAKADTAPRRRHGASAPSSERNDEGIREAMGVS
jgi:hypothetical protein